MRKQHLTNAIKIILETNEEVTIRVKDNSYLFLERAGQLVFDALHKEGYKICTYDGQVQVLEELGADLPKEPKKYTIKDLKKGKVGIQYKGNIEQLIKVLKEAFKKQDMYPIIDDPILDIGDVFFARSEKHYSWYENPNKPDHIKVWVSENDIEL